MVSNIFELGTLKLQGKTAEIKRISENCIWQAYELMYRLVKNTEFRNTLPLIGSNFLVYVLLPWRPLVSLPRFDLSIYQSVHLTNQKVS